MRVELSPRRLVRLPLTPLIDVVFILLLFFMLSSSFTQMQQISFDSAVDGGTAVKDGVVFLVVTPEGEISDSGVKLQVGSSELDARIKTWLSSGRLVIVAGEKEASMQGLITAIDYLKQAGINNVSLAESI